jgi:hypothetical protein
MISSDDITKPNNVLEVNLNAFPGLGPEERALALAQKKAGAKAPAYSR